MTSRGDIPNEAGLFFKCNAVNSRAKLHCKSHHPELLKKMFWEFEKII